MTDKKIKNMLNDEVNGIVCGSRTEILGECGVKTKEKKEIGKTVFKVIGVAASFAFIAALAYVCYLPVYMKNNGLLPASGETGTAASSDGADTAPSVAETLAGQDQTGGKLTLEAVQNIIASSKTFEEARKKINEAGEFAGIYGSGITFINYTLYSDEEAVGVLTVSDIKISYTIGPNSYVLCSYGDFPPSVYGEETDPATGEKIIRVDEYMKDFVLSDESETALKSIYIESARICTSGRKILIPVTEYTSEFIRFNYSNHPDQVDYDGISYYRVETAFNKTDFYLVFLASVQTFKDSWWAYEPVSIKAGQEDSVYSHYLVFSTGYLKMGYASLYDYAVDLPEDLTEPDTMTYYKIGFRSTFVRKYPKSSDKTDLAELWFSELADQSENKYDYGEYNGYRVRLIFGNLSVINDIEVGGYSFRTGSSAEIKAEKDGISYDLKEAYEKGFLTEDDIAKINMIHRARFGLYYDSPAEMTKAARYNSGMSVIMSSNTDQDEIDRLMLSLFKSIFGKYGTESEYNYCGYDNLFAPDRFLVCIMKKSDGSEYTAQDFPELELTAVGKLMDYKDGTCGLVLYLKNPGEENVLEAIRLMCARSDVKYAEPNFIMIIDD